MLLNSILFENTLHLNITVQDIGIILTPNNNLCILLIKIIIVVNNHSRALRRTGQTKTIFIFCLFLEAIGRFGFGSPAQ